MGLRIEIRDSRLSKRLSIAAGTDDPAERDRRRASLLQLCGSERGRAIIERLRDRKLRIEEVHRAVGSLDLASLESKIRDEDAPAIGLASTIDSWLAVLEGTDRSPQTIAFYRSLCNSMEAAFGVERDHGDIKRDRNVASITFAEGEAWLTGSKQAGQSWSPRTQTVAVSVARQVWDRAIAFDEERHEQKSVPREIARNIWRRDESRRGIKPPPIRKTRVEFLRRKQAARLLRSLKGTPLGAWVAVGIYAGLRGGEAANLRIGADCDVGRRVIRVQPREGQHAWRPKTNNSVRNVPMHPALARWIRAHVRQGFAGRTYVFRSPGADQPISRSTWRWWTKEAFERGKIRYGRKKDALTYHSLRHTFASWLTVEDVHPLKISKLMGDTVEMVIRTYSHLVEENLEEAVRRI